MGMTSPGGVYDPRTGTEGESGVYLPDSSAAAAVTTLKDDPGGRCACSATESNGEFGFEHSTGSPRAFLTVLPWSSKRNPRPSWHRAASAVVRSLDESPFGS